MKKAIKQVLAFLAATALALSSTTGILCASAATEDFIEIPLEKLSFVECVIEDNGKGSPIYNKTYNGNVLSIGTESFETGIWSHPRADVPFSLTYNIDGAGFDRFRAYVGPDNVGYGGTEFMIYADGKLVFSTPKMKKGDGQAAVLADIDLKDVKTLRLVQTDGGDSYGGDSGCWGNAAFLIEKKEGYVHITSPARSAVFSDWFIGLSDTVTVTGISGAEKVRIFIDGTDIGKDVAVIDGAFSAEVTGLTHSKVDITVKGYIGSEEKGSDSFTLIKGGEMLSLSEVRFANNTDAVRGKNSDGTELSVGNGAFSSKNGFSVSPKSGAADSSFNDISFDLNGSDYKVFRAVAGISDTANKISGGTAELKITADGKEIYSSGTLTSGKVVYITAEIPSEAKTLTLSVGNADGNAVNAVVNLCEPMIAVSKDTISGSGVPIYDGLSQKGTVEIKNLFVQLKTLEGFSGFSVGVKGNGEISATVYKWDYSCKNTLNGSPLTTAKANISGSVAAFDFYRILPAGEYLIAFGGEGKTSFYPDGNGSVYAGADEKNGVISMSVNFTDSADSYLGTTVTNGSLGFVSNKTSDNEKNRAREIWNGYNDDMSTLPFSVTVDGKKYSGFGDGFTRLSVSEKTVDTLRDKISITYTYSHVSGLEFTAIMEYFENHAAISWTIYIKNITDQNSPAITDFYGADTVFAGENPYLYSNAGCGAAYRPTETAVTSKLDYRESTGRSTETSWPYYNLMYGDGGVFLAIGWTGNWASSFIPSEAGDTVQFTAGEQALAGYLKPGEEIRSPLMAFVYYDGRDYDRSVNVWRRFLNECNAPRDTEGELFKPAISVYTGQFTGEMGSATEKQQLAAIDTYVSNGITPDWWWMDALWHTDFSFWMAAENRFPTALKSISDKMATLGGKTMLWFAPETTTYLKSNSPKNEIDGTTLNPDWIIEGYAASSGLTLMDMTNPEAVEFLKTRIIKAMEKGGISLYREDMNYCPGVDWTAINAADPSRSGIFENLYVQGHYALWDGLIDHFPGLFIDSCASGGNRNDLETLRRAVILHRIDYFGYFNEDSANLQAQTMGIMSWFAYNGVMTNPNSTGSAVKYRLRSAMTPWMACAFNVNKKIDWDIARQAIDECRRVSVYCYDDFYALTPYSTAETDWCAYEYFSEDKQSGYAVVFRRAECSPTSHIVFKGLDPSKNYTLSFEDGGNSIVMSGFDLVYSGIDITLPCAESSEIIWITEGNKTEQRTLELTVNASHDTGKKEDLVLDNLALVDGMYKFSFHLNIRLIDYVAEKGAAKIIPLEGYSDIITVGGTKLSEISGAVVEYDLENNFINVSVPEAAVDGVSAAEAFDVVFSGKAKTESGIPMFGEYTFTWQPEEQYFSGVVVKNTFSDGIGNALPIILGGCGAAAVAAATVTAVAVKKKKTKKS